MAEQDRSTCKGKQRQRVAKSPSQAMLDDIADMGAPRGDARYRRNMVGLQRVLHAEQKSQAQNKESRLYVCIYVYLYI